MNLTLKISPCPNDTFAFDALINHRIDLRGYSFQSSFADIEELNGAALSCLVDIGKVSYAVVPLIARHYAVLDSGSALGRGNGPLLVAREDIDLGRGNLRVAIPGEHTTANRLLTTLMPQITNKIPMLFSDIAGAIMNAEVDAGVLIHEGRFTYRQSGLRLVADLGALWEQQTGLPLPLGAIVVRRSLDMATKGTIEQLIGQSVTYALRHPLASADFVRSHAQEMSQSVTTSHIEMFVNRHSVSLEDIGRRAVCRLTGMSQEELFL